jgi:CelD/BcsL family acetyltransferase involved in cellulose biosynthesis
MSNDALSCGTIRTADEFATLADSWDRLVRTMARPCPYLLHGWLDEWWRRRGARLDIGVHVASRAGKLVAALPLMVRRRFGVRIAEFLGDPGYGVPLADLLVGESEPPSTAVTLLRYATARYGCVDLRDVPMKSRLAVASRGGYSLLERLEAPVLDVSAGWETVAAVRIQAKNRREYQRVRRRLAGLGPVEVTVARTRDELVPALHEAFRLHALRWQGRFDGSDFGTAEGRAFEEAALVRLAAIDVPRIVTLKVDGRPIAFNYYFALGGRLVGHHTAFDPAYARFSPGQLNMLDTIEVAAGEGLTTIEFLGGAERFKTELADHSEPLYELCGLAGSSRGRAYVALRTASVQLRRRLKRSPALRRMYHGGMYRVQRMIR